ncbi:hypothetical protein MRBLMR1_005873 [Neorhizobium sp. LMR1-1-1.1]
MTQGDYFIGHRLTNLLIPGEPDVLEITTSVGVWTLRKEPRYEECKAAIGNGQCAETYSINISGSYSGSRSTAIDAASDELIPLCLGASFLTAMSVAPSRSLPSSEVSFIQVGPHFPRPRAMGLGFQSSIDTAMFKQNLEAFVLGYPAVDPIEKIRLISHHFLDALAFWSIEDLVLSTTTILEIIAITAKTVGGPLGQPVGNYAQRLAYAASRFALPQVPHDFRDMRNDLVHEGTLSGTGFPGKTAGDCGLATAEALDWIDVYIFAAMRMGRPGRARFTAEPFTQANSFSL